MAGVGDRGHRSSLRRPSTFGPIPVTKPASRLPHGTHAAMLIDNAGWHAANELRVPPNITLVHLPPYSPELNAIEKVWQYLRDRHLSHRVLDGYDAVVDAACRAWNAICAEPGRLRSLTSFPWLPSAVRTS